MAGYYVLKRVSIENVIDPISRRRRRRRRRRRIVLRLSERLETALFKIRRLPGCIFVYILYQIFCVCVEKSLKRTHR